MNARSRVLASSRHCDNCPVSNDSLHKATMNRTDVPQQLAERKAELLHRYGVIRLALFGSVVRDSARADSDVDILVSFDGPATSSRYFGVQVLDRKSVV